MSSHIRSILDEVHEEQRKLREEAEENLKKFMEERGLTLFELIVDYEITTKQGLYPETFDDFDIRNNEYKLQATLETSMRKRTPEERDAFLKSLEPLVECDCGHYRKVHHRNFNVATNCLEPSCDCILFVSKD